MNQCLEEIIKYCKEDHHAGGLLLSGKWGSGKSYLLKNELKKILESTHVLIFISLFGISSIDEMKKAVMTAWIDKSGLLKGLQVGKKLAPFLKEIADLIPGKKMKAVGSLLSFNLLDFIKIEPKIDEKRVILVFDDLERTSLSPKDVLGVINDYCENQEFPTIIVANEDILAKDNEKGLSYANLKEKIIQRTVYLEPDYETVVPAVIKELTQSGKYQSFLEGQKDQLVALLSGKSFDGTSLDEIGIHNIRGGIFDNKAEARKEEERKRKLLESRPHNIRVVKAAILDFERVFELLEENSINEKGQWFCTFLTASILLRNNLSHESPDYNWALLSDDLSVLYPGCYQNECLIPCLLDWVGKGIWNEQFVQASFKEIAERQKNKTDPLFLMKTSPIYMLEEKTVESEFPKVLELGYSGELTLSEYAMVAFNSSNARKVHLHLPCSIDWERLEKGLLKRLDYVKKVNHESFEIQLAQHNISFTNEKALTEEEANIITNIELCEDDRRLNFPYVKQQFLEYLSDSPLKACDFIIGRGSYRFDEEMARASVKVFESADNNKKNSIVYAYSRLLASFESDSKFQKQDSVSGLTLLKEELEKLLNRYRNKEIATYYTQQFIQNVQKCLESISCSDEAGGEGG